MSYQRDTHYRRSIRLSDYDYTRAGVYYITVCTFNRACMFGQMVDGAVRLNKNGEIARDEWLRTSIIRPNVTLDAFVVMPNHIHMIFHIKNPVGAHGMRPILTNVDDNGVWERAHVGAPLRRKSNSVGSIVAGFKSATTKHINVYRNTPGQPVWQRNYYEHVIRNDHDLTSIRQYIADNPGKQGNKPF
jgi:putative transposase